MITLPMRRGIVAAALLIVALTAFTIASEPKKNVAAQDTSTDRTITVSGSGQVMLDPNLARVYLGVDSTADTAEAAMQQNAASMGTVIDQLKALGIAETDIKTTGLNLYPYTEPFPKPLGPETPPIAQRQQRFRASNNVQVVVRDLSKVAQVVDTSVARGANMVSGVSFGLSDDSAGQEPAMQAAVTSARKQADFLAKQTGVTITGVKSVSAGGFSPSPIPFAEGRGGAAPAASTPIQPGQLTVTANVTVVYLIG